MFHLASLCCISPTCLVSHLSPSPGPISQIPLSGWWHAINSSETCRVERPPPCRPSLVLYLNSGELQCGNALTDSLANEVSKGFSLIFAVPDMPAKLIYLQTTWCCDICFVSHFPPCAGTCCHGNSFCDASVLDEDTVTKTANDWHIYVSSQHQIWQ